MVRTTFGEWLGERIREKDWTLRRAAAEIGVEQSSLSRYINGVARPSRKNLRLTATAFGIDRDELEAMIETEPAPRPMLAASLPELTGAVLAPMITSVSAGGGYQHDGYEPVRPPAGASRHLACFRVRGDCMAPTIADGDTVIVDLAAEWRDGSVVLARVGDDLLVKRAYHVGDRVRLHPDADGYPDTIDPATQVLGVVVRRSSEVR